MLNYEIVEEFTRKINQEKAFFDRYTLIKTGKLPSENFNAKLHPKLSEKAKEFGFELKFFNMILQLDSTNENIIEANEIWHRIHSNDPHVLIFNSYLHAKILALNSYIIHDMKHFADDIIAMTWMLKQEQPFDDICVSSIGQCYSDEKRPKLIEFDEYMDFLLFLNDFDNAYKHSYANNATMLLGRDEPCIYALYSKKNKKYKSPAIMGMSLAKLVENFNAFYTLAMKTIEKLCTDTE